MKVLANHHSPETAYLIEDYPAGFTARCQKKCWLEIHPTKGTRFCYQTSSRKSSIGWNAVKHSTYSLFGCMYLDENNHVQWSGLSPYDLSKAKDWLETYRTGLTEEQIKELNLLINLHERREAKKTQGNGT